MRLDASTIDRPFGLPAEPEPIVHVLDLPLPPSVNRIWRKSGAAKAAGTIHRSPEYKSWVHKAGLALLVSGAKRGRKAITGRFTAIIEIQRTWTVLQRNKFDLENRTKALFDFCQEHGFIGDDRDLEEYTVKWTSTNAPHGCRITLRSCE